MKRLEELDSLRGVAAMTVVLYHFQLAMSDYYSVAPHTWVSRLISLFCPLYAGPQAVFLFFVLSGFVLSLPYAANRPQKYWVFATRRVTRLYLPYLCSLPLALAGAWIWHGNHPSGDWAAGIWKKAPEAGAVVQHILFVGVYNSRLYNPPIWSLIQEMRISLVFPALWMATRALGTKGSLCAMAAISSIALSASSVTPMMMARSLIDTISYSCFFIGGILLAKHAGDLTERLKRRAVLWVAISMFLYWYAPLGWGHLDPGGTRAWVKACLDWTEGAGACGLIVGALAFPRTLLGRVPIFLGRISYSLYLVHCPILMALSYAAHPLAPWRRFPVYLGGSLALATVFCLWVEEPLMRWGRSITPTRGERVAVQATG